MMSFIYDFDTSACCFNLDGTWNCSHCYGRKSCPEAEEHILDEKYENMIEEELIASAIEKELNIPDFEYEVEEGTI